MLKSTFLRVGGSVWELKIDPKRPREEKKNDIEKRRKETKKDDQERPTEVQKTVTVFDLLKTF